MRVAGVLALLALASGCGSEEEPAPAPAEPVPMVAPRAISAPPAFALVPSGEGAVLLWSAEDGVRAQQLGPLGQPGEAASLAPEPAVELAAAAAGRRVGVAWVGASRAVQAAYSLDAGQTFAAPDTLGATVANASLDVAAHEDDGLVAYHRIPDGPCVASDGSCARFSRAAIGPGKGARGTEPLEVRHPCDPLVSGALWHDGTAYHAVCHADPEPSTMVYAIRPSLHYAAPLDLSGCAPLGIAPLDAGVAVFTRCGGHISASVLDEMGRPKASYERAERSARCEAGRPVLRLGAHTQTLDAARADLELLLPPAIAPSGARAIWTGESLLVAAPAGGALTVQRYECEGARLERTDPR